MSEESLQDSQLESGAVLLADEIDRLAIDPSTKMIEPYCPSRLRPASYQLTLGDEIHLGGKPYSLAKKESIVLEPHQVAVVSTYEALNIPRDVIARWSLRVTKIYEGLLWTGGPQVDPGWKGPLFCPIYNLAERNVVLRYREPMFTMDFLRTTGLSDKYKELKDTPEYSKILFKPQRETTLADHDKYQLHSAPYEALKNLKELTEFRNFASTLVSVLFAVMFTAIGAVVAALAVVAVGPSAEPGETPLIGWPLAGSAVSLFLSAASFVLSLGAIVLAYVIWKRR